MNKDKYVFTQMVEFLNNYKFLRIVKKYDGNRYVKHFTCWNQLLTLMFGQLCNHESLRYLIAALNAHQENATILELENISLGVTLQKQTRVGTIVSSRTSHSI